MIDQKSITFDSAKEIYSLPFNDLVFRAHSIHREHFDPNKIQMSKLFSIKTGGCQEDCSYCSQSVHNKSGLKPSRVMNIESVVSDAKKAKANGATRYCIGAGWRSPRARDMNTIVSMIQEVKSLGLETCVTLGLLNKEQAQTLGKAGLDYYNHNIDTSESFYPNIITTRKFSDRIETLKNVRESGIKVCCGGIIGLGETTDDRISMLITLASLNEQPESVPINMLIPIPGTKLANAAPVDSFDFIRVIALARILMPKSWLRLSAGRDAMNDTTQAFCFFAGANSIFTGDTLLTARNPNETKDAALFNRLGITPLLISQDHTV